MELEGEAEPEAQRCGGHQQHGVGPRIVFDGHAAYQQGHGQRVGHHAGEQYPLQGEPACEGRETQGPGDGHDHLGQEEDAVPALGQVVAGRRGEDGGGGGKGDQAEPLEEPTA